MKPRLTLIVARARNGVIGRGNALPWQLPEDLAHFRRVTMGQVLLLGRHTWHSIGRPLPGRDMIVIGTTPLTLPPGVRQAADVPAALALVPAAAEVFIGGGAGLYASTRALAGRIVMTTIDLEPDGDTWFPAPEPDQWITLESTDHQAASGIRYTISDLRRRALAQQPTIAGNDSPASAP